MGKPSEGHKTKEVQKGRKLIDEREVLRRVPGSHTSLWRWCRAGLFPLPVQLGPRRKAWFEDEVDDHIDNLKPIGAE